MDGEEKKYYIYIEIFFQFGTGQVFTKTQTHKAHTHTPFNKMRCGFAKVRHILVEREIDSMYEKQLNNFHINTE